MIFNEAQKHSKFVENENQCFDQNSTLNYLNNV